MLIETVNKQKEIFKTYMVCLLSLFVYSTLLVFLFIKWVVPVYGYSGYTASIDWPNIYISTVYLSLIGYFIVVQADNIKSFFISMLALQVIIPMLCLYCFTEECSVFNVYVLMCVVCFILLSLTCLIKIELRVNYSKVVYNRLFLPLMTAISIFTIMRYIALNGLGIFNLDITKVYDYRFILRETMGGILSYVDAWTVKIVNPFCVVYALYKKNRILSIIFIILQVLLFGFSSHKSVLFSALVLVVFFYVMQILLKNKCSLIFIFIISLSFTLLLYFNGNGVTTRALFNRLFFTPARINFYYYDYFSVNKFDWFKQSFLRHFVNSEYVIPLSHLIGLEYMGNIETNANTGFLGAGYAQGGFWVLVIYSVIIGLLISLIASLAKKVPPGLTVGITILPMSSLFTSGDLPGSLVTGGLMIALLLLYIFSRDPTIAMADNNK